MRIHDLKIHICPLYIWYVKEDVLVMFRNVRSYI